MFRLLLCFTICLTAGSVFADEPDARSTTASEPASRPNFVVIMADDLGYADLSGYGGTRYQTPNLDRMAAAGAKFLDYHSSGPVCSPTRAGLLTGRYQQRSGVDGVVYAAPSRNRHHGLQVSETTLAEVLKDVGYRTGIFGKWHLGYEVAYNPTNHGFDEFRGYVSGNVDYISHIDGVGIFDWWRGKTKEDQPGYSTHLITENTVDFIDRHHDQPFCVYVAHEAPHYPYQTPESKPVRAEGNPGLRRETAKEKAEAYPVMVREMDAGIGKILSTLKRHGIENNTLVIFVSDNGATPLGSNGIYRGFKGSLWEGGHRVPGIVYWPGTIPAGTVVTEPTICLDIMPTLLELAGTSVPEGHSLDGTSLVPLFEGEKTLSDRQLHWSYRGWDAMRIGRWKYLSQQTKNGVKESLYDLDTDPEESNDLSGKEAERFKAMRATHSRWKDEVTTDATEQPTEPGEPVNLKPKRNSQ